MCVRKGECLGCVWVCECVALRLCACVCVCACGRVYVNACIVCMIVSKPCICTHTLSWIHTCIPIMHIHTRTEMSGEAAKEWLTSFDMQELVVAFETEGYDMEGICLANWKSADLLDSLDVNKGVDSSHKLKVSAQLTCVAPSVYLYVGSVGCVVSGGALAPEPAARHRAGMRHRGGITGRAS